MKLWYKELSGYLASKGFTTCKSDECVLVKRMKSGKHIIVMLYVDDILVMSEVSEDRYWVKSLLEDKCKKVTSEEGDRLPYLGMTIVKRDFGYELCMQSYVDDLLKFYGKDVREFTVPASGNLFKVDETSEVLSDKTKFHSVVAKLLYLGKRGRSDVLMSAQFLCTRVQAPTKQDITKLERVLGYLKFTRGWT